MADQVGQQFGNYRLLRLLGRGGFADVYLGEHIYMGTQAAIKLLHAQLVDKDMERFQQEARTVAHLEHPHIVRVLEFGVEEQTPFLVLGYAPNGTLRTRHPRGSVLPLPTIVAYVKQVADALQYAHSQRVIHRDIKPENMLLGRNQEILLTDFGIALVMPDSHSLSANDLAGTAAYMAPEQIEARPRAASDQYSLAIVVYEWLSGVCPFQGTFTEIALKHAAAPVPSLRERISDLPTPIEDVIVTALAKEPTRRFASIQSFAQALEQASQSAKIASIFPSSVDMEGPTIRVSLPREQIPPIQPQAQPGLPSGIGGPGSTPVIAPVVPPVVITPPNQPMSSPPPGVPLNANLSNQTDRGGWIGAPLTPKAEQGVVTPFLGFEVNPPPLSGASSPALDVPAPLPRYRFSKKVLVVLVVLAVLVIGGGIFGSLSFSRLFGTQVKPPSLQVFETAVVNMQTNHAQAVAAYNQNVATHGNMFGFDAQHTRFNSFEEILGPDHIARVQQMWAVSTHSRIFYSSPSMVNGVVYVGTYDNKLYAFNAVSGQQKWVVALGGTAAIYSSPAVVNGIVYVGSTNDKLYAFDAISGQQKWIATTGDKIFSSPTVVNGSVYIGSYDNRLHAFDAITGKPKWTAFIGAAISYSSPAVVNGTVYIGSYNHKLYAFDAITGKQKWIAQTGGIVLSSPSVVNNVVYAGSYDHKLYAFDAKTGHLKWSVSTGGSILSSPAVVDGTVYVGSFDHKLYAFDVATGHQKWVVSTGDMIEASPLVADGLIYISSWDHKLYAFDAITGQQKWVAQTGGKIYASPLVANGVIYVGSSDGKLYAFALSG